ncbi:SDR family oxidoreductase [Micromonospora tulbaghiae]|uniref:SDR family oxidoreductase n=1 Tax=Micromonospora tulbaghiae TaxID=479978 RepID=UPI0033CDEEE2
MKIVVIGGSGLIGSKLVKILGAQGHEAVPASPKTGVNTLTGEGVADVLFGADAVVDVSNSPSLESGAALEFFETSTRNLLAAAADAGVGHYVVLSVVGSERLPDSGYMRAKIAQEKLITASGLPYSLVHATQFFEFLQGIVDAATDGDTVHLAPVLIQPMAADDVAAAVAEVVVGAPTNGVVEVGGPEQLRLDELGRSTLAARRDPRSVVSDPDARYFGAALSERSLVPADGARIAGMRLDDWRTRAAHGR